jgi:hypothetical protein
MFLSFLLSEGPSLILFQYRILGGSQIIRIGIAWCSNNWICEKYVESLLISISVEILQRIK